jgi:hypothetical protein
METHAIPLGEPATRNSGCGTVVVLAEQLDRKAILDR